MTKEEDIKDWQRMYDSLTNPKDKEERRRKIKLRKRLEERKKDTGL